MKNQSAAKKKENEDRDAIMASHSAAEEDKGFRTMDGTIAGETIDFIETRDGTTDRRFLRLQGR